MEMGEFKGFVLQLEGFGLQPVPQSEGGGGVNPRIKP
jgi:hypothetical protein